MKNIVESHIYTNIFEKYILYDPSDKKHDDPIYVGPYIIINFFEKDLNVISTKINNNINPEIIKNKKNNNY